MVWYRSFHYIKIDKIALSSVKYDFHLTFIKITFQSTNATFKLMLSILFRSTVVSDDSLFLKFAITICTKFHKRIYCFKYKKPPNIKYIPTVNRTIKVAEIIANIVPFGPLNIENKFSTSTAILFQLLFPIHGKVDDVFDLKRIWGSLLRRRLHDVFYLGEVAAPETAEEWGGG